MEKADRLKQMYNVHFIVVFRFFFNPIFLKTNYSQDKHHVRICNNELLVLITAE